MTPIHDAIPGLLGETRQYGPPLNTTNVWARKFNHALRIEAQGVCRNGKAR